VIICNLIPNDFTWIFRWLPKKSLTNWFFENFVATLQIFLTTIVLAMKNAWLHLLLLRHSGWKNVFPVSNFSKNSFLLVISTVKCACFRLKKCNLPNRNKQPEFYNCQATINSWLKVYIRTEVVISKIAFASVLEVQQWNKRFFGQISLPHCTKYYPRFQFLFSWV
jgi:hypothetical protein